MKSENKNFIINVAYQLLTYLFPLITVTYISRTLGVDNVGIYSYTYSIVYMFMLVAMLGVNNYGNREIARVRDDIAKRSKKFLSIYAFQLLTGAITTVVYVGYLVTACSKYQQIAWIQLIFLLSACVDINWFYFGMEQFKLTITRNLIIKVTSIVLIFLLVKETNDLWKYTLIMAGSTLASQLYLVLLLPKYIVPVKVRMIEVVSHCKSLLILFIPVLSFGIYRVMDKTMIGEFSSVTELGYYENAERLINIPIAVTNALGTVMLPRMAYLLKKDKEKGTGVISDSMQLAMILSTVMALGLSIVSFDAVVVLFGEEFRKSGAILIALSPTIIAGAWANVIRTQYLIPQGIDNVYVCSTVGGAVINLVFNIILIKRYGAYGACVGTIAAEAFVMIYQSIATRNVLPQKEYIRLLLVALGKAAIATGTAFILTLWIGQLYIRLAARIAIAVILSGISNKSFIGRFLGKEGERRT